MKTKKEKIKSIIKLEKQHNNNYKWIYKANNKDIDKVYQV